jgi:DNA-binding CsgD family transcriptional regulator/tetratricopeptide (TPR) repeat protein
VSTDWPLIGREVELANVAHGLEDPACGGVLLIGAAGVGKTRLGMDALRMASERGFVTRAIRATPGASEIPLAALAPLFPDLDLPSEPSARLFRAVRAAIDDLGGGQRPVVMVDDAQELDVASAALLDQLVAAADVFVLLTARSNELRGGDTAETVVGMWKDERILRIDLAPLDDAAMRELTVAALNGAVDGATVQALVGASAGNVLFLREVVQGGRASGALTNATGVWRLTGPLAGTSRLRDLIGARLVGLLDQEREALELIALAEPVALRLLASVVPLVDVEQLEARGLVELRPQDEVGLVHPLYGEVLRSDLSPIRRQRLCRSLAEAAEGRGELRSSEMLRAAVWRLEGGDDIRPDLAVTAGRIAFQSGNYDLAVRLARSAWDADTETDEANRAGEVGLLLGEALDYAGRPEEADEVLAVASSATTDQRLTASLALRRASNLFRGLGRADDAEQVVEFAMRTITDPGSRRDLDALRANHLLLSGNVAEALEVSAPLLAQPGDTAFAQASLDVGTALALAGRTTEAIQHTQQALAARLNIDDVAQLSAVAVYAVAQSLALCEAGRLAEAGTLAQAGYARSIELGVGSGQAWFASVLARVFVNQGRLGAASHLFRETAHLFGEVSHPGQRWGLGGLALAAGQMGDRSTADWAIETLARMDASSPTPMRLMDVDLARGRAWAAAAWGNLSRARALLWDAVDLAERWGQLGSGATALHDLVRIGDRRHATKRLQAMAERVDGELMAARVSYARALDSGRPDDAADAVGRFEACGAMLFAAEAAAAESQLAREQGMQRRAAEARARSARLLEACENARTPALSDTTVLLSNREREVALLAASGLTSRQIADRLFLSVRTVDNHLQRVYMKLGVTSRDGLTEVLQPSDVALAAAAAAEPGLSA